jgi:EAL domain-containing protein (putative c-di-GMP-specific phosphodiesterase class I)
MVTAMRLVASAVGATLVAEGVETQAELDTLVDLGVHTAQGYLLGKPQHAPTERR